jgi:hypothetical protein
MSIQDIYIIEPYNAYSKTKRKKHWHENVEEQMLIEKIIKEQQKQIEIPPPGAGGQSSSEFFNSNKVKVWNKWNTIWDILIGDAWNLFQE